MGLACIRFKPNGQNFVAKPINSAHFHPNRFLNEYFSASSTPPGHSATIRCSTRQHMHVPAWIFEVELQACLIHMRGVLGVMWMRWIDFRGQIYDPGPSMASQLNFEFGAKTAQMRGQKRRENKIDSIVNQATHKA